MPYIGRNHTSGDHVNNFKVLDDISSYTATFDGTATSVVNTTNNTIRVPLHRFIQGQRVLYTNGGGGNIGGLTTGTAYFIIADTANTFKLATSASNATNSIAVNISSVGTGTSHTINASFDGVNTRFKITHGDGVRGDINSATQLNIAVNNVVQRPNINSASFTEGFSVEDQHKLVFKTAPTSNDIFWGSIIANNLSTFDVSDHKIDTFTGDGSTTEFNLSHVPANNESLMVTINGVLQHPSNATTSRAYTLIASVLKFTAAPGVGDEIQVRHLGFAGATTADVSGFYGRTGNVVLTNQDDVIVNKINVGTGVTIESNGQATFVGVVTFGSGSTTIDNNVVNVGTALTLGHTQGLQFHTQNLHSAGFEVNQINTSGIITASSLDISGNASIGGVLTYEDVTNIDSVGIITAQKDIHVGAGLSVVGVSTFSHSQFDDYIRIGNPAVLGSNTGSQIGRGEGNSRPASLTFNHGGSATLELGSITAAAIIGTNSHGANNKPLRFMTGMNIGTLTGGTIQMEIKNNAVNIFNDLDVDGHTNLDNVNIAGISTFTGVINSTVSTGTAPFVVASTTKVTNLNADLLDGKSTANSNVGNSIVVRNAAGGFVAGDVTFGNIVGTALSVSGITTISNDLHIESTQPRIYLTDTNHNSDWFIGNSDGTIIFYDTTLTNTRFEIYPGNSPTIRPFISTPFTTDCRFDGFVRIGAVGASPNHSLTVGGNSNFSGISTFLDIDVDGHTNLDNVSVAGITTINGGTLTVSGNFPRFYFIDTEGSDLDAYIVNNANLLAFGKTNSPTPSNDVLTLNLSSYLSTFKGNVAVAKDLDVDGHTNLDNVSIAGVTTITGALDVINSSNTTIRIYDSTGTPDSFGLISYNNGTDADDALIIAVDGDNQQSNSHMRFYVDGLTSSAEKFRVDSAGIDVTGNITATGTFGINATTPSAGDLATGASQNAPLLHVYGSGSSATSGAYNLLARFEAGSDADETGAMIVLNHSNDRGLAIEGGRRTGNYAHGALKMIDNLGRVSEAMLIHGGAGQGVDHITFATGVSTTTTRRLLIDNQGNIKTGTIASAINFTDSNSGNTKSIEIGASGGGDALFVAHSSGYGVGYFGYEAGGDRLVIACDGGGNNNKIDFITDAGTSSGGGTDNLNGKSPKMRILANGRIGISKPTPLYMLDIENPNPGNDSKQLIQRWMNSGQNTLELHMYGGNVDQNQFAAVNAEQTISFLTGVDSSNVDSTETTLLMTQNRDLWNQGPSSGNNGGGLFIGRSASPYGNLCALRDGNGRPVVYMAGKYPEINLVHEVPTNTSHGGTIRFATYIQSTNTATGKQFVIGTNGSGTFLDIGYASAGTGVNVHNGINNHSGTTLFRVDSANNTVKIAGHIIQVGYARYDPGADSYTAISIDTKARSAAYLDFTPKYANSKLLIMTRMHTRMIAADGCSYGIDVSTNSGSSWSAISGMHRRDALDFFYKGDSVNHHYTGFCLIQVDASNTSSRRYSPWGQGWGGGTWEISYGHGEHSVTVYEIATTI